jgi:VWFA-related protein
MSKIRNVEVLVTYLIPTLLRQIKLSSSRASGAQSVLIKRLLLLLLISSCVLFSSSPSIPSVKTQTRERVVAKTAAEVIKVDVDLVTIDALVLKKDTARIVGDLKKDDFLILEDGTRQQISHFSQDSLPLSVLLLIDRGGCLDPFSEEVHRAANEALSRLKPIDEVAVMSYHSSVELLQPFTRDRTSIADALNRIPPHDEEANHCLNKAFSEAADYMVKAGNPVGRRVVIAITGVTRNFDCSDGPSARQTTHSILESGSVVCGLVPTGADQRMENGIMRWATRVGGVLQVSSLNIKQLADETGGELLQDKPENLDTTFNTLIDHLRTRYSLAFVSSNKKRDGSLRKLKVDVASTVQKSHGKIVVRARRSYVAPRV